jgi:hypothetical protein
MVIKLCNNVLPLTFNVPIIFVSFDNVVNPDTFNELLNVDALETNILEKSVLFNNDVDVACKFEMFKFE